MESTYLSIEFFKKFLADAAVLDHWVPGKFFLRARSQASLLRAKS